MAAGKIFDRLEPVYLVKLLINHIQFGLKFRESHLSL